MHHSPLERRNLNENRKWIIGIYEVDRCERHGSGFYEYHLRLENDADAIKEQPKTRAAAGM